MEVADNTTMKFCRLAGRYLAQQLLFRANKEISSFTLKLAVCHNVCIKTYYKRLVRDMGPVA